MRQFVHNRVVNTLILALLDPSFWTVRGPFPPSSNTSARRTLVVPVLSEHITLVHPSGSTELNFRTMAPRAAIFVVPSAKQVVMTTASPSGIAATARAKEFLK
jgi:hypothetical protein